MTMKLLNIYNANHNFMTGKKLILIIIRYYYQVVEFI